MEKAKKHKWLTFSVVCVEMLIAIINLQFLPPLIKQIITNLQLNFTQSGILIGIVALFGIFICIPLGALANRINFNKLVIWSFVLIFCGTFGLTMPFPFVLLCVFRVISGIGIMALAIVIPSFITKLFRHDEIGLAMGIFNTIVPIATILAFVFLGGIGEIFGWRITTQTIAGLAILGILLHLLLHYHVRKHKANPHENHLLHLCLVNKKGIWILALVWLFYNAATFAFAAFGTAYFQELRFPIALAGFFASAMTWGGLLLSPLIGYFLDKGLKSEHLLILGNFLMIVAFALFFFVQNLFYP